MQTSIAIKAYSPKIEGVLANQPFFEICARQLIEKHGADNSSAAIVITPNQSMARHLLTSLQAQSPNQAVLAPVLLPLNHWQKEDLLSLFAHDEMAVNALLALPRAMPDAKRQAIFAKQIQKFGEYLSPFSYLPRAMKLAASLMQLQDQFLLHDVDEQAAQDLLNSYSDNHYDQAVKQLFSIILQHWPDIAKEERALGNIEFQLKLQSIFARFIERLHPEIPVYILGSTGSILSTRRLMHAVHEYAHGHMILPGVPGDNQTGTQGAFLHINRTLDMVNIRALNDAENETSNTASVKPDAYEIATDNAEQEAKTIALIVKDHAINRDERCLVVSQDDRLSVNIVAKLEAMGLFANHLANHTLAQQPAAQCLSAALMMMLNHKDHYAQRQFLANIVPSSNMRATAWFDAVSYIDQYLLRQSNTDRRGDQLLGLSEQAQDYVQAFGHVKEQLLKLKQQPLTAHEWFLQTNLVLEKCGFQVIADSPLLSDMLPHYRLLGSLTPQACLSLMQELGAQRAQALDNNCLAHPNIHILSSVQARFHPADCVILAGFHHEAWPKITKQDSWLNQRAREQLGLPVIQDELALAAHDVWCHAHAATTCYVTRAGVYDGKKSLQSPLRNMLHILPSPEPYCEWALMQHQPQAYQPEAASRFAPAVVARPSEISVSRLNDLLKDPYRFYAYTMLRLKPLEDYMAETEQKSFGVVAHRLLEWVIGSETSPDSRSVQQFIDKQLRQVAANKTLSLFWQKQLHAVADYALAQRESYQLRHVKCDVEHALECSVTLEDSQSVVLKGSLDLVENHANGVTQIIDYKTGQHASLADVKAGRDAQLLGYAILLENEKSAIPEMAGYTKLPDMKNGVSQLCWQFSEAEYAQKKAQLTKLLETMRRPQTPFLAHPLQALNIDSGDTDYDGVSRYAEWG